MNLNELTQKLIDIESVTGNENEVINFIEKYLTDEGYDGEIFRNEGGLIVSTPNSNPQIAFTLSARKIAFDILVVKGLLLAF